MNQRPRNTNQDLWVNHWDWLSVFLTTKPRHGLSTCSDMVHLQVIQLWESWVQLCLSVNSSLTQWSTSLHLKNAQENWVNQDCTQLSEHTTKTKNKSKSIRDTGAKLSMWKKLLKNSQKKDGSKTIKSYENHVTYWLFKWSFITSKNLKLFI